MKSDLSFEKRMVDEGAQRLRVGALRRKDNFVSRTRCRNGPSADLLLFKSRNLEDRHHRRYGELGNRFVDRPGLVETKRCYR